MGVIDYISQTHTHPHPHPHPHSRVPVVAKIMEHSHLIFYDPKIRDQTQFLMGNLNM